MEQIAKKVLVRRRRRILVVLLAVVLVLCGAVGFYAYRSRALEAETMRWRTEGMTARQAGDYGVAIDKLTLYLGRKPTDTEALAVYVDARPHVESPKFAHLTDTLRALRYLVQLQPAAADHRRRLLDLYRQLGMRTEAIETADALLAAHPADAHALDMKSQSLIEIKKYPEALAAAKLWVDRDATSVLALVRRLSIRVMLGQSTTEVMTEVDEWGRTHSETDARYQLLKGMAFAAAEDRKQSLIWLRKAAEQRPIDDDFSRMLVAQMVSVGDNGEDVQVLQGQVAKGAGIELRDMLLKRLWEVGRWQDVNELAKQIDPRAMSRPIDVLALACMAARNTGKKEEAGKLLEAISSRKGGVAAAWQAVLSATQSDVASSRVLAAACREALASEPNDQYLRYYFGEALAGMQEPDMAIEAWREVAGQNQTWGTPLARMAELLLAEGHRDRAAQAASFALRRSPNVATGAIVARIAASIDQAGPGGQGEALSKLIEEVRKAVPDDPDIEVLQIQALARSGRQDEAKRVGRALLERPSPLSEATLLRFADVSRQNHLGLEDVALDLDGKQHGITPTLALTRALNDSAAIGTGEALKSFRAARAKNAGAKDAPEWDLAEARYLDLTADASAAETWRVLCDKYAADLHIQEAGLDASATRRDRSFTERGIQRIRAIVGEQSVVCSLAHARVLIDTRASDADDREIAETLKGVIAAHPTVSEPRSLWAQNLQQAGKLDEAIDQLQVALTNDADSASLTFRLAQLYAGKGDRERAAQLLVRLAGSRASSPAEAEAAATLLAQQGELSKASAILETLRANAGGASADHANLTLANLYLRRNQLDKAEAAVSAALKVPSADALVLAARICQLRGKPQDAISMLQKLDGLQLPLGEKEMAKGSFYAATGKADDAGKEYQAATIAAPDQLKTWRALVTFLFMRDRTQDVDGALASAEKAAGGKNWAIAIRSALPALSAAAKYPELRSMVADYVQDPAHNPATIDALGAAVTTSDSPDLADRVSQVRTLGQRFAHFEGVQLWALREYVSMRRMTDATATIAESMKRFPDSADVAGAATTFYGGQRRWADVLDAASTWKSRGGPPERVDAASAQALLSLGRSAEAVAQIQSYFPPTQLLSDHNLEMGMLLADALRATGKIDSAAALLLPPSAKSAQIRAASILFAAGKLDLEQGRAWLKTLSPSVDTASADETALLAKGWSVLAARHQNDVTADAEARRLFATVEARQGASAAAIEEAALFDERHGDKASAVRLYQRALKLDPNRPIALNELAVLMAGEQRTLDEAAQHATAVVKLMPGEPEFLDTLAMVKGRAGDFRAAQMSFRQAIKLDPENVRWRIAIARAYLDGGERGEAVKAVESIDTMGADLSQLPNPLREQLQTIRGRLTPETKATGNPAAAAN